MIHKNNQKTITIENEPLFNYYEYDLQYRQ